MYHINYIENHRVRGVETQIGISFERVKAHARRIVDLGSADRVEVRDINQALKFHYPRITRPVTTRMN